MEKNTELEEHDLPLGPEGGAPFIRRDLSASSGPTLSTSLSSPGELSTPQEPPASETSEHPLEPIFVEGLKNRDLKRKINEVIYYLRNRQDLLKIVLELAERVGRLEGALSVLSASKAPTNGQTRPITTPTGLQYETKKLPWRPHGDGEKYWLSPGNQLTPLREVPADVLEKGKSK